MNVAAPITPSKLSPSDLLPGDVISWRSLSDTTYIELITRVTAEEVYAVQLNDEGNILFRTEQLLFETGETIAHLFRYPNAELSLGQPE